MKGLAVDLANNKLLQAHKANARLQYATSYAEAEEAWAAFLIAASGVYSKLEQGSKGNGKSAAWFGRKKHQRKTDPLLRYLHFARNSEEHGVEHITHRDIPTLDGVPLGFTPDQFGKEVPLKMQVIDKVTGLPGEPVDVTLRAPNIMLRTVTDSRFSDKCDPPDTHLGKDIGHPAPQKVADLAIPYLRSMIAEARQLVVGTA